MTTTSDFITALFCRADDQLSGLPKHPEAHLWPSEVVTLGLLHALKGVGNRPFYCTFRTLFRPSEAILEEPPAETGGGSCIQTISCVTTHYCYIVFSFITTSCKVRGPLLPLQSEPQGFGFPTERTPEGNQAPGREGLETMTDVALVSRQGTPQVLMTIPDPTVGALAVHR